MPLPNQAPTDDTSKSLGFGAPITIEGKQYRLTPFVWEMHGQFSEWLEDKAWYEVEKLKLKPNPRTGMPIDPLTYKERHDAVTALVTSGYYKPGSAGFSAAEQSWEGHIYKTFLMLLPNHPDVTLQMVEGWYKGLYAVDLENRIRAMEADPNPNRQPARTPDSQTGQSPSVPSAPPSSVSPGI